MYTQQHFGSDVSEEYKMTN